MSKKTTSFAGKLNSLFPNCKEVTMLIVKEHETKLSSFERFKLYFHTAIVCKFCKAFKIQSRFLNKHVHNMAGQATTSATNRNLSTAKKASMQAAIDAQTKP